MLSQPKRKKIKLFLFGTTFWLFWSSSTTNYTTKLDIQHLYVEYFLQCKQKKKTPPRPNDDFIQAKSFILVYFSLNFFQIFFYILSLFKILFKTTSTSSHATLINLALGICFSNQLQKLHTIGNTILLEPSPSKSNIWWLLDYISQLSDKKWHILIQN